MFSGGNRILRHKLITPCGVFIRRSFTRFVIIAQDFVNNPVIAEIKRLMKHERSMEQSIYDLHYLCKYIYHNITQYNNRFEDSAHGCCWSSIKMKFIDWYSRGRYDSSRSGVCMKMMQRDIDVRYVYDAKGNNFRKYIINVRL